MTALRWPAGLLLAAAAVAAPAPERDPSNLGRLFAGVRILPVLQRAAQPAGFVTAGVAPGAAGSAARGDQAVALISYDAGLGSDPEQWLLRLTLDALGDSSARGQDLTFYSTVGDSFVFHSGAKALIDVDLLGSTRGKLGAPVHRRVKASSDFLMLDISRATAAIHSIKAQIKDRPPDQKGNFAVAAVPFPADEVARDRLQLEHYHLAVDDRRAFAGMLPALTEFIKLVQDTPGLQDILGKVFERPSVLSMIRHIGNEHASFAIDYADAADSGELFWPVATAHPPAQLLVVSFQLLGKPVVRIALLAVAPRPPLEVTAGVMAAAAWSPSHPERTVVVKVIAARSGP